MTQRNEEFLKFNAAMDTILKADPKVVKEAMETDKEARAEQRKRKKGGTKDGSEKDQDME